MRRQDEILSLFPSGNQPFRRLLLDLAADLVPVYDSASIEALLTSALASGDPWTRALGCRGLLRFGEAWVAGKYRVGRPVGGTWTHLHLAAAPAGENALQDEAGLTRQTTLRRAMLYRFQPLVPALAAVVERGRGPLRSLALLCLARIPTPDAVEVLARTLATSRDAEASIALCAAGTRASREAWLALASAAPEVPPQWLAGLQSWPAEGLDAPAAGRAKQRDSSGGSSETARAARASGTFEEHLRERLASDLAGTEPEKALGAALGLGPWAAGGGRAPGPGPRAQHDWAQAHRLAAMARSVLAPETPGRCHDGEKVALLRTLAVRAAAASNAPATHAFLLEVAERGSGSTQAMALDVLARHGVAVPVDLLAKALSSPHWRVRLNAALLMAAEDPERALEPILAFLTSPQELERVSGAFALAYIQDENAEKILVHLTGDPSPRVQAEAVSSLARYSTPRPARALVKLALSAEPEPACRALQALAWYAGEGLASGVAELVAGADRHPEPRWQAALLRAVGALAGEPAGGRADLFGRGFAAADPEVVVAALDGWSLAGGSPARIDGAALGCTEHPRVRARRAVARWMGGDHAAIGELTELVGLGGSALAPALQAVWELGSLGPWLGRSPRLGALENALVHSLKDPDYAAFSARQLELPVTPQAPAASAEADPLPAGPRPRLPSRAAAVADLPRPRSVASKTHRTSYYKPPESKLVPSKVLWAAGLLGLLVALGWWMGRGRGAETVVRAPPPPSTAGPVRLAVSPSGSGSRATPRVHQASLPASLGPGESVRVEPGERAVLVGPYPGLRVEVAPGELRVRSSRARPGGRLGCELELELEPGRYRIDARPGTSQVELTARGQGLSSRGGQFSVQVEPEGGRVQVKSGTVRLQQPQARELGPGQEAAWGDLRPAGQAEEDEGR